MRQRLTLSLRRKLVVLVQGAQSRIRISRNSVLLASRMKTSARRWACLRWKTGSARPRQLKTAHWNRCAACALRRRRTGAVGLRHYALLTRRKWVPCVSKPVTYRGHIRRLVVLDFSRLTVLVSESRVVHLT